MKSNLKKRVGAKILLVCCAIVVTAAVGVAIAEVSDNGPAVSLNERKDVGTISNVGDLPVFRESATGQVPTKTMAELAQISRDADAGSLAANVDLGTAVQAPISGSTGSIWIAKSGGDGICVFVPANGSFSSACGTKSDLEATGLLGISQGAKPSEAIAYQVVPEGGPPVTATSVAGVSRELPSRSGVTASVVAGTDEVSNGVATYDLAKLSGGK